MHRPVRFPLFVLPLLVLPWACSGDPDPEDSILGSGGNVQELGSGGTATGSGGSASGSGSGSGGVSGPSGGSSSAGGATAAGGNTTTGSGGESTAGSGGAASDTPVASVGCGKGGRPAGGKVYKAGESWLLFPEKYDGNTPLPVVFGFHGCGASNFGDANRTEFYDLTRNTGFEDNYVIAIPLAISGSCMDQSGDMDRAKNLYTELVENYCVDTARVFGTGHSYGSGFLMGMTGNQADFDHFNWKALAPVSGWKINNQSILVPTMYIQGILDSERKVNGQPSDGADVVAKIVEVNECSATTTPYAVDACNSNHDGDPVDAGCREYSTCGERTIWCRHDDSDYSGTYHGMPCFYKQAVYDFFESL